MHDIFLAALGLGLLVLGRKLFWLFVGALGFATGLQAAQYFFGPQPFGVLWVAGLVGGIVGALLALFFQHLAIVVGGFAAGASTALYLMAMLGQDAAASIAFIAGLVGGVIGAVALYLLFDWALIVLSSLVGAGFMVQALNWHSAYVPVLVVVLILAGVLVQGRLLVASREGER